MLTKGQAQAASNALLQPARAEQLAHATKFAKQQRVLTKRKWLGGCALLGLAIGTAIGSAIPGHPFTAGIVGFIVGAIVGALVGKLHT